MYILSMVFLKRSVPKSTRIGRKKITKKLLDKLFNQSHTLIDAYIKMGYDAEFRKDIPTRDLNIIYSYANPRISLLTEVYALFSGEYITFISDYKRIDPSWKKLTKMGFAVMVTNNDEWLHTSFDNSKNKMERFIQLLHLNNIASIINNKSLSGAKALNFVNPQADKQEQEQGLELERKLLPSDSPRRLVMDELNKFKDTLFSHVPDREELINSIIDKIKESFEEKLEDEVIVEADDKGRTDGETKGQPDGKTDRPYLEISSIINIAATIT